MKADSQHSVSSVAPPECPLGSHLQHLEVFGPTRTFIVQDQSWHDQGFNHTVICHWIIVCFPLTTLLTAPMSHMLSASRVHTSSCPQWAAACRGVHPSMSLLSTSTPHCKSTLSKARERREGKKQEGEKRRNIKIRQKWTGCHYCHVCGLMLTSGLRCIPWQRRRAEPLPWCLSEVWVCRLLPALPWRPGAWSSPLPFGPCPRLCLWCTHKHTEPNLMSDHWKQKKIMCQLNL